MTLYRAAPVLVALLAALHGSVASAHGTAHGESGAPMAAGAASAGTTREGFASNDAFPAVAARYTVQVLPDERSGGAARTVTWHVLREARSVVVMKGDVEDAWYRDDGGRVRFERTLHGARRIVEYSPGELETLGVATEWRSIATFLDGRDLEALARKRTRDVSGATRTVLAGTVGNATLRVQWSQALQLPLRVERREADGARVRFVLERSFPAAPADWPRPRAGADAYLRIDAADFGDMSRDPIVRRAEAMDVGAGWRAVHHRH